MTFDNGKEFAGFKELDKSAPWGCLERKIVWAEA
jgi:IS30 family transposase